MPGKFSALFRKLIARPHIDNLTTHLKDAVSAQQIWNHVVRYGTHIIMPIILCTKGYINQPGWSIYTVCYFFKADHIGIRPKVVHMIMKQPY